MSKTYDLPFIGKSSYMKSLLVTSLLFLFTANICLSQGILWEKCYGGGDWDNNPRIKRFNGGYLLCGTTQSGNGDVTNQHGGLDVWLVKLDSSGNLLWQKAIGWG